MSCFQPPNARAPYYDKILHILPELTKLYTLPVTTLFKTFQVRYRGGGYSRLGVKRPSPATRLDGKMDVTVWAECADCPSRQRGTLERQHLRCLPQANHTPRRNQNREHGRCRPAPDAAGAARPPLRWFRPSRPNPNAPLLRSFQGR